MKQKTWVEISKSALAKNIKELRAAIGNDVALLAIIKGNAYGAGIEAVVSAIQADVDWFGVDSLDEADNARLYCQNPVLILSYVADEDAVEVVEKGYSVLVYDYEFAESLSRAATVEKPAKIHLKIDTGLARLGLWADELFALAEKISHLPNVIIEGLYTHYARLLNEAGVEIYPGQLQGFNDLAACLEGLGIKPQILHSASSMATVLYKETHLDMVRVGITLYGLWGRESLQNFMQEKKPGANFYPVLSWKTKVIHTKKVPRNTGVGYMHSEVVSRDTMVAILGAGYYDGIDKRYAKIGHVLIRGKRARILGSIAMNMCMVDVTDIEGVQKGDEVVLIGRSGEEEISAYEFARVINTSTYEVLSRINPLLLRTLVS